jgi:hypothetical protein
VGCNARKKTNNIYDMEETCQSNNITHITDEGGGEAYSDSAVTLSILTYNTEIFIPA